jgi:hypothetical protein
MKEFSRFIFRTPSISRVRATLAGAALALSLSSCGLPPQTNAVPVDVQPLTQCPSFEAGGRALQTGEDKIDRIVATTLPVDSEIC